MIKRRLAVFAKTAKTYSWRGFPLWITFHYACATTVRRMRYDGTTHALRRYDACATTVRRMRYDGTTHALERYSNLPFLRMASLLGQVLALRCASGFFDTNQVAADFVTERLTVRRTGFHQCVQSLAKRLPTAA
jgi:hypothetical protein